MKIFDRFCYWLIIKLKVPCCTEVPTLIVTDVRDNENLSIITIKNGDDINDLLTT